MADNQPIINSLEAYQQWIVSIGGYTNGAYDYIYDHWLPYTSNNLASLSYFRMSQAQKVPESFDQSVVNTIYDNEHNFWLKREIARFNFNIYSPIYIRSQLPEKVAERCRNLWHHFPHQSLDNPTMIAYTPNWEYGLRDRQVRIKIGKYLAQYYGDLLSEEEIRTLVSQSKKLEIQWAYGSEAIWNVYKNGPQSCMVGKSSSWDTDPVAAYGYQYPDGSYEFGCAYTMRGDVIASRAIVALRPKKFVRVYGDDGSVLLDLLKSEGYEYVGSMADDGLRLLQIMDGDSVRMPYLDGNEKGVKAVQKDEKGQRYYVWAISYDHWCENADGYLGSDRDEDDDDDDDEYRTCHCCDRSMYSEDMNWSDHHDEYICNQCVGQYNEAIYNRSGDTTYIHQVQTLFCETDDNYYLNEPYIIERFDLVEDIDGNWRFRSECTCTIDDEWVQENDAFPCDGGANNAYAHAALVDNTWYIDDSDSLYHPDYATDSESLTPIWQADRHKVERAALNVVSNSAFIPFVLPTLAEDNHVSAT